MCYIPFRCVLNRIWKRNGRTAHTHTHNQYMPNKLHQTFDSSIQSTKLLGKTFLFECSAREFQRLCQIGIQNSQTESLPKPMCFGDLIKPFKIGTYTYITISTFHLWIHMPKSIDIEQQLSMRMFTKRNWEWDPLTNPECNIY